MTDSLKFWFDPACPWAWMTSRWVDEVARSRDFDVEWRVMSLAVLNEDQDLSEEYRAFLPRALKYTRLVQAAEERHGQVMVKALYDALGAEIHIGANNDADEVIALALAAVGLPASFSAYADSDEYDTQMRASHFDAINRVGMDVGTPVIAINDVAFFGPVVSPAPMGDQALALWDGVVAAASYDGFFELKRSRTRDPNFDVSHSAASAAK
ncbi:DsbA family protein [Cryobacterium psychrophilum]|uniref:Disulfide bond formation protein DsbA n=1 Tax=Cryobacterium psychrophilum TaxID=41988 RepID=A0A4Y8KR60_9MICO|nr:DsbA family protein [Cryobacterium psychrophilum]TDW31315.1 2-hydroxychromene-2-carboxylate isomerase [Cryobacterium psychrophilum]TFD78404.1 disulfide bond formation protein DsbA [Cryobacterium psychrophilum]